MLALHCCDGFLDFGRRDAGAAEVYREAGEEAERKHDEISRALKAELSNYEKPEGIVMASSSSKIIARNPE